MTIPSGKKLGRYEIRSKLGAGGMGEVYLALDTELDRTVAIKILPEALAADQQRLQRFVQEAKAASALNHPHILTIHDIGTAGPTRFIATEFIDGETLRQRISAGMNLSEILETAIQAGGALAAAHAAGIIHRDIKPENIMVRRDGYIKVLDFGLAKLTEPRGSTTDTEAPTKAMVNTGAGTVMGTANYMSPEQAKGTHVDARTDLWSLGAVLYEMITGHVPFPGETPTETISLILQKEAAPLTRFTKDVPAELERIVTKALTKDREERYQTAKDLLIDLRNLKRKLEVDAEIERTVAPEFRAAASTVSGQSATQTASGALPTTAPASTASAASSAEYIASGIKQHKIGVGLAAIVLLIGAVGLGLYLHARNTEVAIESIAVLPFANQNHDADTEYLSDGMTESLINSLSQLPKLSVKARSSVFRYKGKEFEPQQVGNELNVQAVLTGRVAQRGDQLTLSLELVDARTGNQIWGEQYSRKLTDLISLQSEVARDVSNKLRARLSGAEEQRVTKRYTDNAQAYQLYLKGNFYASQYTKDGLSKGIEYYNQAIALDPNYALAYNGLAYYYIVANDWYSSPNDSMPKAREAAKRALAMDETLADAHTSLAVILQWYDWDWATAEREYRRAIELNPNDPRTRQYYAWFLSNIGRVDEARAEGKKAQQLDPLSPEVNAIFGSVLTFVHRNEEAIEQLRRTVEVDSSYWFAHDLLGRAYEQKGDINQALTEYLRARQLEANVPELLALVGRAYALSGKKAEAQKVIEELKELSNRTYVPPYNFAIIYAGLGNKDEAFVWLNRAYDERSFFLTWLKVDSQLDNLRDDPRFQDLLRRVNFPQ